MDGNAPLHLYLRPIGYPGVTFFGVEVGVCKTNSFIMKSSTHISNKVAQWNRIITIGSSSKHR